MYIQTKTIVSKDKRLDRYVQVRTHFLPVECNISPSLKSQTNSEIKIKIQGGGIDVKKKTLTERNAFFMI